MKENLLNSMKDDKISLAVKFIRVARLVRIVRLYKAVVFIRRNIEKKKQFEVLKRKNQKKLEIQLTKEKEKLLQEASAKKAFVRATSRRGTRRENTVILNQKHGEEISNAVLSKRRTSDNKYYTDGNSTFSKVVYFQKSIDSRLEPDFETKHELKTSEPELPQPNELNYDDLTSESKINKTVSDCITKKVIVIIFLMLLMSPLVDDDVYSDDNVHAYNGICEYINNYYNSYGFTGLSQFIEFTLSSDYFSKTDSFPIIEINFNGTNIYTNQEFVNTTFRMDETAYAYSGGYTIIKYSYRLVAVLSSKIDIIRTFFAIGCLCYIALVIENDSKRLILEPLQMMIKLVEEVASDPINAQNLEALEKKVKKSLKGKTSQVYSSSYEIKVIQLAILRISTLLAIGFGEAGGEILKENLGTRQELNPMLPGKKKNAIFGFCDIRGFPDINVALQEKTMVFVNEIAEIVHSSVDIYGGAANKNIGDAFLVVWKIEKDDNNMGYKEIDYNNYHTTEMADKAVLGFLRVIYKVNKDKKLRAYKNSPEIQNSNNIFQPFKVSMGFGLHIGWAIEGPIGSIYKMDCSYLSPNVNIAARLEGATRQYGVTLLLSGELYRCLSATLKSICRLIDIVNVKGSEKPLELYTIYVNLKSLKKSKAMKHMNMTEKRRFYARKKTEINELKANIHEVLLKKCFQDLLQDKRGKVFHSKFRVGFDHYIKGEWEKAYHELSFANFLDKSDGPTRVLLKYIIENGKKAPDDWNGVHILTSK
jgi:class 3 adenylate cyclase